MEALKNKRQHCAELTEKILSAMQADGYACKNEMYIYRALNRFCEDHYEGMYSCEAGDAFLEAVCPKVLSKEHMAAYRNSILRISQALAGNFHWKPVKNKKPYESSCFDDIVLKYESYLMQTNKTEEDIRRNVHLTARFLAHAESLGITEVAFITPAAIYSGFEAAGAKSEFRKIKTFFRYANRYGLNGQDLSSLVPTVSRHKPIPTVYTADEIGKILASVDRSTKVGKRDYCIVLLAARFGLRTSDITGLSFENIDRSGGAIRLTQKKTGVQVEFPLLDEIAEALDDYISNARPESKKQNIFLCVPRPYAVALSPQRIYGIVSGYITGSGIRIRGRRHGAHALRSSLATQLLNEGNTYSDIQQILGHTSPEAATHYICVETDKLRVCAIEVPEAGNSLRSFVKGRVNEK